MKDNEKRAALLVMQAIKQLGSDNALGTARAYLGFAINSINEVTKKREKREKVFQEEDVKKKKLSILKETEKREALKKAQEMEQQLKKKTQTQVNEWDYPDVGD